MSITIDFSTLFSWFGWIVGGVIVVVTLILIVNTIKHFFASRGFEGTDRETMRRKWQEIERMLDTPGQMSAKLAIFEADKLLDYALKALAMSGETLGERLKFAQYKYPELREVWWAHKIRNQLAHEASFHLDPSVAKNALRTFKKALERLGAI